MDDGAISHHAVPHVRGALALPLSDDHVHQRCPVTRYRLDHEQEKIHAARTTLPHVHREGIVRWRNLLLHHWCRGVGYWLRACYRARSHVLSPSHVYLRLVDEFILHLPDRLWRSLHDHELRVLLCTAINRGARPGMVLWVGAAARPVLLVLHHHAGDELVAYWKRNRAEEIEEELFLWLRHCNILDSHPVVHILDARAELAQSGGFFFHDQLEQSHATSWWPRVDVHSNSRPVLCGRGLVHDHRSTIINSRCPEEFHARVGLLVHVPCIDGTGCRVIFCIIPPPVWICLDT